MPEWIKIEEEQPQKDRLTLFCGIMGGIFLGYYVGQNTELCGGRPCAAAFGTGHKEYRSVTAWIPVPDPYVDEKKLAAYEQIKAAYMYHHRRPK